MDQWKFNVLLYGPKKQKLLVFYDLIFYGKFMDG